jgi:CheY-like chemotaxis protein
MSGFRSFEKEVTEEQIEAVDITPAGIRNALTKYRKLLEDAPRNFTTSGRRLMGNARLLVVEDDIDIANMLKIYFTGCSSMWMWRIAGADALEKTKHVLPHLIVLDIMLPDIDGYEVCRNLRTSMRTSHIPVIFLTQKDERSDKLQGLELGADDYITKPFDIEELKLRVQGAIRRSERESLTDPRSGLPAGRLIEEAIAPHHP